MTNTNNIIKETVEELLRKMSFEGEVDIDSFNKDDVLANIQTKQAGYLIGQSGANLDALQFLARIVVNKRNEEPIHFILDVNSYRKSRIESLRDLANNIAQKTLSDQVSVTLRPMPAYERRIIHLVLAENLDISTESVGEGAERRIVVKPANY
ncbi:KH domain-containing protein [Patescibacteria group bacterium]|nr:KH domain-containing protein [Patescibacteria group bacterium]MBU4030740.1 KH domain-containing protein [Patescibacteria group bacterium]MBU4082710.1 KH domain-containing protein [Patescibacteria group bacterium]MCG2809316.1 KH domain-containing protein [Candidatus Portnoybacteria bacterium]